MLLCISMTQDKVSEAIGSAKLYGTHRVPSENQWLLQALLYLLQLFAGPATCATFSVATSLKEEPTDSTSPGSQGRKIR